MRRPMLSADQLIEHMKQKGIRFTIVNEQEARRQLLANKVYFKLTSFCDNYTRVTSGPNAGQYERLEFAYLQELMRLDLEVRHLLLDMSLDVEHALKVALIAAAEQRTASGREDGYRMIRDFLLDEGTQSIADRAENIDRRAGNFAKKIRQNRKNPYCDVLIEQYENDMPVWAFVELVTFGELQELAEYYQQRTGWQPPIDMRSMDRVRQIRNACAHGNCVINDLRPTQKQANVSSAPRHITEFLQQAGVKADTRAKKLSNPRINQIVHTLYAYDVMVQDEYVRALRFGQLKALFEERMLRHREYFEGNPLLVSTYDFFRKMIAARCGC